MAKKTGNTANGRRKGNKMIALRRARSRSRLIDKRLRCILRRNGVDAAREWAKKHLALAQFGELSHFAKRCENRRAKSSDKAEHRSNLRANGYVGDRLHDAMRIWEEKYV